MPGPLVLCYSLVRGGRVFEHVAVVGKRVSSDHRRLPDAQAVFLQRLLGVQLLLLGRERGGQGLHTPSYILTVLLRTKAERRGSSAYTELRQIFACRSRFEQSCHRSQTQRDARWKCPLIFGCFWFKKVCIYCLYFLSQTFMCSLASLSESDIL